MNREEIMQKLKTYEEHEIFYREYYLAKQNLNSKKSFLSQFDPNELYQKRLIVPDIKGSWRPTFMNEEIMDQRDLIKELTVLKHFRYTPTFKHEHSFYELVYCVSGSCQEEINDFKFTLTEGQFCLIPPRTTHSIGVFDDSIVLNIIIWRRTFEDIFYNLLRKSNIISDFFNQSLYLYEQNSYMLIDTLKDNEIKNIILDMYGQTLEQKPFYELVRNAQIIHVFSLILQNYEHSISFPYKPFQGNHIIIQMIAYIEHHFKDITLQQLAEHFNFSSNYCSRMIKELTSESFTEIVLSIKFTKAKNLLESTTYPISQIATQCGFNNIEHFNRLFKKKFSKTPGQYRKELLL